MAVLMVVEDHVVGFTQEVGIPSKCEDFHYEEEMSCQRYDASMTRSSGRELSDGRVFRGATSSAGEWGHTTVALDGRSCRCGARGCLEAYVGARGILATYQLARDAPSDTAIDERLALEQLRVRLMAGDEAALHTVRETGRYLGVGVANLINLLNPDKIVLGGWAGLLLGEHLLPIAIDEARRHALTPPFNRVSIELCQLGTDAIALGAAILVVEPFLEAGGLPQKSSTRKVPNRSGQPDS